MQSLAKLKCPILDFTALWKAQMCQSSFVGHLGDHGWFCNLDFDFARRKLSPGTCSLHNETRSAALQSLSIWYLLQIIDMSKMVSAAMHFMLLLTA